MIAVLDMFLILSIEYDMLVFFDLIRDAPLMDQIEDLKERNDDHIQTAAFSNKLFKR